MSNLTTYNNILDNINSVVDNTSIVDNTSLDISNYISLDISNIRIGFNVENPNNTIDMIDASINIQNGDIIISQDTSICIHDSGSDYCGYTNYEYIYLSSMESITVINGLIVDVNLYE